MPKLSDQELRDKASRLRTSLKEVNSLMKELWQAGCKVEVSQAAITSGGFGANGNAPATIGIDVYQNLTETA